MGPSVQQWHQHGIAYVKASGEHFEDLLCLEQRENCFHLKPQVITNINVKLHCFVSFDSSLYKELCTAYVHVTLAEEDNFLPH